MKETNKKEMKGRRQVRRGYKVLAVIFALVITGTAYGQVTIKMEQNQMLIQNRITIKKVEKYIGVADQTLSNNPYKSLEYGKKALRLSLQAGNQIKTVESLIRVSWAYVGTGEFEKALTHTQKAYKISKEIAYKSSISESMNSLGLVYWNLGQHEKSYEYLEQGLLLRNKLTK